MALARCFHILFACLAFATASFAQVPPVPREFTPDHYVWYNLSKPKPCGQNIRPQLADQFLDRQFKVLNLIGFLNPVSKEHDETVTSIQDPSLHYSVYGVSGRRFSKSSPTLVRTQFGDLLLKKIGDPKLLFVPAAFDLTQKPTAPTIGANDHYLCYGVTVAPNQQQPRADIVLDDPLANPDAPRDFVDNENYSLLRTGLKYLCNPADKNEEGAPHIDAANNHLACFALNHKKRLAKGKIADQFISTAVSLNKEPFLCVPAQKILCGPENTDELCSDGIDNDCDGDVDCEDVSCAASAACNCQVDGEMIEDFGGKFASGDTTGETDDFTPECAESDAGDLAFSWTAPTDGFYHFRAGGRGFDTVLSVLDSDCSTTLGCNDNIGELSGLGSWVQCVDLNAGQSVVVVVDGKGTDEGLFFVESFGAAPMEFGCSDEIDDDCDGDFDCDDSDCNGIPPCACLPTGPEICSDFGDNDCDGDFNCDDADCIGLPPCTCAINLDLGSSLGLVVNNSTTIGQGNDSNPSCAPSNAPDVGYTWTAPSTGFFEFSTAGSAFDTVLSLLNSSCTTTLACNDQSGFDDTSLIRCMQLTSGTQIVISVDGYQTSQGQFDLTISSSPATETNCNNLVDDDCDGLIDCVDPDCSAGTEICGDLADNDCDTLVDCADPDCPACVCVLDGTPNSNLGSATGSGVVNDQSTVSAGNHYTPSCTTSSAPDLAYSWTAPSTGKFVIDTLGSTFDTVLYAFNSPSCTTAIACDDDGANFAFKSRICLNLTASQEIYIVGDGFSSNSGLLDININPAPATETNCSDLIDDDCDGFIDGADIADCP